MLNTLNFIKRRYFFNSIVDVVALLLACVLILLCYFRFVVLKEATQVELSTAKQLHMQPPVDTLDEQTLRNLEIAKTVQADLNLPWLEMLNSLERIKSQTADVDFISIEPNKKRSEIRIQGQAQQFESITQLIELLSKEPMFKEVALLNQHVEQKDDDTAGERNSENDGVYVFEISIGWQW